MAEDGAVSKDEAARARIAAKRKAKRERQKARRQEAKAAGEEPPDEPQPAPQPAPEPEPEPEPEAVAAAAVASSASTISDVAAATAATSSRTEALMRRVELLAAHRKLAMQPPAPPPAPAPAPLTLDQRRMLARQEGASIDDIVKLTHTRAAEFATTDRWDQAAEEWTLATEIAPEQAQMWYFLGVSQQKLGRPLEAEKSWKRAAKLGHPEAPGMLRGMRNKRAHDARLQADALLQSDKFDKAIGMYTAALNISSDGAEHCAACHNGKATAYGLRGRCAFHSPPEPSRSGAGSHFEA